MAQNWLRLATSQRTVFIFVSAIYNMPGPEQHGASHDSLVKWKKEMHLCCHLEALFGLILMDVGVIFAQITSEY